MTSKEFVAFIKGISLGVNGIPNEEQWTIIVENLMKVKDKESEEKNLLTEIKTEVEKVVKPIIKKFPGKPPDIYC
jgi:archaellum biogenesis ATPase FlaH